MKFREFERVVREAYDAIPPEYREGIDGLVVSRETERHPTLPDIYTLGFCDTESYPSDWVGPETTRSRIVLYWGSFARLAREDPDFDWEAEIHETVEHEVKHHLEWLAAEDSLGDVDYAMDESFKRSDGMPWDPWYWESGEPLEDGAYAVEDQVYVAREMSEAEFQATGEIGFRWRRRPYVIPRPDELGDLHFVLLTDGVDRPPPFMELVLVRKRGWWSDAKRLFGSTRARILESEAVARPADRREPVDEEG